MAAIEWKQYGASSIGYDFSHADQQEFLDDNFTHVTREAIQNVVDHPLDENQPHVKVVFQMYELPREEVFDALGFQVLLNRVKGTMHLALANGNDDREVMSDCRRQVKILEESETFRFLKISDFGTTGVNGQQVFNPAARLVRNDFKAMVCDLGGGKQSASGAGGHGLGKLANLASSQLSTAFFNTVSDSGSFCAGICLNYQTQDTNGKILGKHAYFVKRETPLENDYDANEPVTFLDQEEARGLHPNLFGRTEKGTDVIIVEPRIIGGCKADWKDKVLANCITNFPIALLEGTLEVVVEDLELDSRNIEQFANELVERLPSSLRKLKKDLEQTIQFIKAYRQAGGKANSKKASTNLPGFGAVELYLLKGPEIDVNRVAFFRKQGMSLEPYPSNNYQSPYAGVLIVRGEEGNVFLRSIELADHSRFGNRSSDETISDQEVKNRKERLHDWIDSAIGEFTKIEAQGRIPLKGLDKYIFIPSEAFDGDDTATFGTKPQNPSPKAKFSTKDKRKRVVEEKVKAAKSETEGEEGEIYIHVRKKHVPKPKPIIPGPHPGDTPVLDSVEVNPNSPFEGKIISKKVKLEETILSAGSRVTMVSFQARSGVESFKLEIKAVGEDDTESDLLPEILRVTDVGNGTDLVVEEDVICGIKNNGPKVIRIEFARDPETRLDFVPFVDAPTPAGYSEPTITEEEDNDDE